MGLEPQNDDERLAQKLEEKLILFAEKAGRFLRTGGRWGWATFQSLTEDEQEIAARLADELEARRAVDCAQASTPEGVGAVLAPYDDGDTAVKVALSGFLDSLAP